MQQFGFLRHRGEIVVEVWHMVDHPSLAGVASALGREGVLEYFLDKLLSLSDVFALLEAYHDLVLVELLRAVSEIG